MLRGREAEKCPAAWSGPHVVGYAQGLNGPHGFMPSRGHYTTAAADAAQEIFFETVIERSLSSPRWSNAVTAKNQVPGASCVTVQVTAEGLRISIRVLVVSRRDWP